MVLKKSTLEKIQKIIKNYHNYLLLSMLGKKEVPEEILNELKRQGFDTDKHKSFLEMAYHHNWLNDGSSEKSPKNHEEMNSQQFNESSRLPKGRASLSSLDMLNSNLKQLIEKQKADVATKFEALIQAYNNDTKFGNLKNLQWDGALSSEVREKAKSAIKSALKDTSRDATRNWNRVVDTELSNAISLGSVDRIAENSSEKALNDVFVYRIVVPDVATCRECRKFYLDSDGTPKVYRLSTIISNGSNYGKRRADWKPTTTATHPSERCSQIIELKPGWKVGPRGSQEFIGLEDWKSYIEKKVSL